MEYKCKDCIHVGEWIYGTGSTFRCSKIRGKYNEKEDEHEEYMKVSKYRKACEFFKEYK